MEDLERRIEELHQEVDALQNTNRELRRQNIDLITTNDNKDIEIKSKDREIGALKTDNSGLKLNFQQAKNDIEEAKLADNQLASQLEATYKDLKNAQMQTETAIRQKENAENESHNIHLQMDSLREQWEAERGRVQELQAAADAAHGLQQQIDGMVEDVETWQSRLGEAERIFIVKDERINNLEGQLQKAREGQLSAIEAVEAAEAAAAAASSTNVPATYTVRASLLDELAEIEDDLDMGDADAGSSYDYNLGFSDVTALAIIVPVEPVTQTLSFSAIQALDTISIEPTARALIFSMIHSIDTPPIEPVARLLGLSTISAADTPPVAPVHPLSLSMIEIIDTPPSDLQPRSLFLSTIQTIETTPRDAPKFKSSFMQTEPEPSCQSALSTITAVEITPASLPEFKSSSMQTDMELHSRQLSVISRISTIAIVPTESQTKTKPTFQLSDISSISTTPISPRDELDIDGEMFSYPRNFISRKPKQSRSHISTAINQRPVTPKLMTTTSTQTDNITPSTHQIQSSAIQTTPSAPHTSPVAHKLGWILFVIALFGIFCSFLASNHDQAYNNSVNTSGAYGYPVQLLGLIPIGYDIGDSYWSELLAKTAAVSIQTIEAWAGVDRTFLY